MRSIVKSYRASVPEGEIDEAYMTGYERGRLQRAGDKISDLICEIMQGHAHHRIAFFFLAYMEGLGVKRRMFGNKRSSNWSFIWQCQQLILQDEFMTGEFMAYRIMLVGQMLDVPLAEVPGRVTLLKLGLPIQ